jgi:hypothetical protein
MSVASSNLNPVIPFKKKGESHRKSRNPHTVVTLTAIMHFWDSQATEGGIPGQPPHPTLAKFSNFPQT